MHPTTGRRVLPPLPLVRSTHLGVGPRGIGAAAIGKLAWEHLVASGFRSPAVCLVHKRTCVKLGLA